MATNIDPLEGSWLGDLRGTHVGTAFLRIFQQNAVLAVDLRINIQGQLTAFDGVVNRGPPITIDVVGRAPLGTSFGPAPSGQFHVDNVTAAQISTTWQMSNGAMGVANWLRHVDASTTSNAPTPSASVLPVQFIVRETAIGAVTIYRQEFEGLIAKLRQLFQGRFEPGVTATIDRQRVTKYARDLLASTGLPGSLNECTIYLANQDPEDGRSIAINLRRDGGNNIVVQARDETWATGVSVDLTDFMNRYTSFGTGFFRKYGLNVNGLIFLIAIILAPDLGFTQRIIFFTVIIIFMIVFHGVHARVANSVVYLDDTKRNAIRRQWPTIFSAIVAALLGGALKVLFNTLSGTDLIAWIKSLLGP